MISDIGECNGDMQREPKLTMTLGKSNTGWQSCRHVPAPHVGDQRAMGKNSGEELEEIERTQMPQTTRTIKSRESHMAHIQPWVVAEKLITIVCRT
jgi:hypothetical protein